MKNILKTALLALPLLMGTLTACSPSQPVEDGIIISSAYIAPPLKGKTTAAAYLDITNHSQIDDALIDVESPMAETVEIHLTEMVDGIMSMRRQVMVDIKAGQTLNFKPGGYHLMLFDVNMGHQPEDAALTLKFKHAPDMTIIAPITAQDGHSHHD